MTYLCSKSEISVPTGSHLIGLLHLFDAHKCVAEKQPAQCSPLPAVFLNHRFKSTFDSESSLGFPFPLAPNLNSSSWPATPSKICALPPTASLYPRSHIAPTPITLQVSFPEPRLFFRKWDFENQMDSTSYKPYNSECYLTHLSFCFLLG